MKRKKLIAGISLLVILGSAAMLILGSKLLLVPVIKGMALPWGTVISWAALILLPVAMAALFGRQGAASGMERTFRVLVGTALGFSLLWLPVSYVLAGNVNFVFGESEGFRGSPRASRLFWAYSVFCAAYPLLLALSRAILQLLRSTKHQRGSDRP